MYLNLKIPNYIRWSQDAIYCYNRGCICKNCPIAGYISEKCRMKESVLELVRTIGKPKC